jgi:hypothetical protein
MAGKIYVGSYGPYQTGVGGEFTYQVVATTPAWPSLSGYSTLASGYEASPSFQTFCIEGSEYIYRNTTYDAALNSKAMYGGNYPDGDPISQGTGWLYSQFARASWDATYNLSYNYGANRSSSADALQKAIWWLEGEEGIGYNSGNIYMAAVVAKFGSACGGDLTCAQDKAKSGKASDYGVYAINMWAEGHFGEKDYRRQDGLFFSVPDGGTTLVLLGGALMGLGALRRKFSA